MTVELTMLACSVALLIVLVVIQASVGVRQYGLSVLAGPRNDLAPPSALVARAKRVVDNHREGLTIFAPLVLAAAVANIHTSATALGAQLFFYSRVAHAIVYLAGLPMVRPLIYGVGVAGTLMVLTALFGWR